MLLTEKRELVPVDGAEADGVIHNGAEDDWGQQARRELREDLCPEIGTNWIHIIICFSEEHMSLVWENENNILNSTETDTHGDEEQSTISVLNSCSIWLKKMAWLVAPPHNFWMFWK